jgi:MFS family permease
MTPIIFYGWWIVLACFFISFYVGAILFFGVTAFIEPIVQEFGWSYTQVSFAVSLRGLEMGIFAPFVGYLVDRFGSRILILCGVLTVGLGLLLLSFTGSLLVFYICFLVMGFGGGGCTAVVIMAAVANWFRRNVGKALGVASAGFGASGLLIPLIVWLIATFQWRTTLILLALGMWGIGIPLSFIFRDKPEAYGILPDGGSLQEGKAAGGEGSPKSGISFREALRNRVFLYLNIAEALRMILVSGVVTHVMPYLTSVGMSRTAAGWIVAAIPLTSIIGRLGYGWMGDRFDKKHVYALSLGMMGLGMVAFSYIHVPSMMYLFLFLFPPGFGGSMVLRGAFLQEYFGRDIFGKVLGTIMGSASVGGILGPTVAGWVFDTWNRYQLLWLAFAGLMVLATILILRMKVRSYAPPDFA